ncbi:hypothetical protein CGG83_23475 [Vibrio parahaemolyticus]|uniref:hypothetical protein n=2 Tax=Vibrio parahaemolyticus TaxID=670 RepID=UPI001123CF0D|nr:hypothetical protein [Vibrio parahaemolyticus]EIJ0975062.1 hypothetical protein [Vibrio parahaemolyticus]TOR05049.1 hypothetical protein CGG83_23475 [Vibrio parahaemolyticus]
MDAKVWAVLISLSAFILSLFSIFKTHIWNSFEFNCRLVSFSWKIENDDRFCESKFFISCSGNKNLYVDKLYINKGDNTYINAESERVDIQKLLKPGEIEEIICKTNASIFSHNQTYSFIFTLISADTDQFHCSLKMTTKEQENNNLIVSANSLGSGNFSLNSFNLLRMRKVRKSRAVRRLN